MNDFIYEQLVKRHSKATDYLIRVLVIILIIAIAIFGPSLLGYFAEVLAVALIIVAVVFIFPRLKVEYEYILLNHDMQIDVIYNKAKRKTVLEFDVLKAEEIVSGIAKGSGKIDKTYDCTSGTNPQAVYTFITNVDKQNACILIEPDETMKEHINRWLAPHMQLH
jgi:hypothetical protein